jgi:hypothetical protein
MNCRRDQSGAELQGDFVSGGECNYSRFVGDPEVIEMGTERISTEKSASGKWSHNGRESASKKVEDYQKSALK